MTTAVTRRPAPRSPATTESPIPSDAPRHDALDAAARRWLDEGDTPENVAAYASALRELLRSTSR